MIRFRLIIFSLLALMLGACSKNEFNIEFEISGVSSSGYRLVYFASSSKQAMMMETNAILSDGRLKLKGYTKFPTVVWVYRRGGTADLAFYAEKGDDIVLKGDGEDPSGWTVEGSDINEKWSEWRLANRKTLSEGDPEAINRIVAQYVSAHRDSKLSALLMLTTFCRREAPDEFSRLWRSIDRDSRPQSILDAVGDPDGFPPLPRPGASLGRVVLHTGAGPDTLSARGRAKATIAYFWRGGASERARAIDTLRALSRDYPDTLARNIVDISLDPDSMAWRSPQRSDSLRHTMRAWMPRGEADSRAIAFGVTESPMLIVFDRSGRQVYRGFDIEKSAAKFRSLMKQK